MAGVVLGGFSSGLRSSIITPFSEEAPRITLQAEYCTNGRVVGGWFFFLVSWQIREKC